MHDPAHVPTKPWLQVFPLNAIISSSPRQSVTPSTIPFPPSSSMFLMFCSHRWCHQAPFHRGSQDGSRRWVSATRAARTSCPCWTSSRRGSTRSWTTTRRRRASSSTIADFYDRRGHRSLSDTFDRAFWGLLGRKGEAKERLDMILIDSAVRLPVEILSVRNAPMACWESSTWRTWKGCLVADDGHGSEGNPTDV